MFLATTSHTERLGVHHTAEQQRKARWTSPAASFLRLHGTGPLVRRASIEHLAQCWLLSDSADEYFNEVLNYFNSVSI